MNQCKSFIVPHADTNGRFQATKNEFLVHYSFRAVDYILAYRAANGSSSLTHA